MQRLPWFYIHLALMPLLWLSDLARANDPTAPLRQVQKEQVQRPIDSGLVLQSVLLSPAGRSAIINGKLLQEGELIESFTLKRVFADHVVLESEKERRLTYIFNNKIKGHSNKNESAVKP